MRITWAAKSGSDQEQATGRTSTVSADQAGATRLITPALVGAGQRASCLR